MKGGEKGRFTGPTVGAVDKGVIRASLEIVGLTTHPSSYGTSGSFLPFLKVSIETLQSFKKKNRENHFKNTNQNCWCSPHPHDQNHEERPLALGGGSLELPEAPLGARASGLMP
ncbi:hypothetical protein CROQUDRAFT_88604 [Cronartium quercuum f. sp. fusiforme G11]|uniref:Uncharacterized protein n=1 Tax=Cronartium quercuum f. sp. fusiforme G11 TaxID=708437 RepID=A0A9P6NQY5_9BASI|nr:hypothetical protein CROQUDRAFT_88604 [Cronartium quercuum f. sp. fusiforme G11]